MGVSTPDHGKCFFETLTGKVDSQKHVLSGKPKQIKSIFT
jgi:hypothetical protein